MWNCIAGKSITISMIRMLQSIRERLVLLLLALLPFHAFFVTVGTRLIVGKGHAPLAPLALWKEMLLGMVLLLMICELFLSAKDVFRIPYYVFRIDVIDALILALLVLGVFVTAFTHQDWRLAAFGFKYDFLPLIAFLLARRVPWSERFRSAIVTVLLTVGTIVATYGILTAFLPTSFFRWLGYGPAHSLYFADAPLAAFQQVSETTMRRIQSTMSGPNQLGVWLLVPLGILVSLQAKGRGLLVYWFIGLLVWGALLLSFSRTAWIAAFVMVAVSIGGRIPRRYLKRALVGGGIGMVACGIVATLLFPSILLRLSSSRGHITRPLQAIGRMIEHPFGTGLGTAGPATNRTGETCVHLRPQDDPSWAKTTPSLCVFLGSTQVQPTDHACRCPFLPENWYLQIGVEMGWLGFFLFIALVVLVLRGLLVYWLIGVPVASDPVPLGKVTFLVFLGLSVAAFFLHAWEDSAAAWTAWLLAGMAFPLHAACSSSTANPRSPSVPSATKSTSSLSATSPA